MPDVRWLISTPAWGARHVEAFTRFVLPATTAATEAAGIKPSWIVHTDAPELVKAAFREEDEAMVVPVPKPDGSDHARMSLCHRQVIAGAGPGDVLAFVNADMIPSIETFAAARARFEEGKRLVMMASTRTLGGEPPIGVRAAELHAWAIENLHPVLRESTLGVGRSRVLSTVYFRSRGNVICRAFHLHPFAMVADRPLTFDKATIDDDLPERYAVEETHVVVDLNEAAFAEMSPADFQLAPAALGPTPFGVASVARWALTCASPRHWWNFGHAVRMAGDGDAGDEKFAEEVALLASEIA